MPKALNRLFRDLETLTREGHAAIQEKLNGILHHQKQMQRELLMEKEEIAKLVDSVTENTNATQAAADALTAFATSNAELTKELEAAIANSTSDVSDDIKAASAAIGANTAKLLASIPQVAKAVTDNTAAAS